VIEWRRRRGKQRREVYVLRAGERKRDMTIEREREGD